MWLRMEKERINTLPIHLYSGKILTCFSFAPFTFSVSGWLLILSECLRQIKQSLCKPVWLYMYMLSVWIQHNPVCTLLIIEITDCDIFSTIRKELNHISLISWLFVYIYLIVIDKSCPQIWCAAGVNLTGGKTRDGGSVVGASVFYSSPPESETDRKEVKDEVDRLNQELKV